jgi:hypothetical protein
VIVQQPVSLLSVNCWWSVVREVADWRNRECFTWREIEWELDRRSFTKESIGNYSRGEYVSLCFWISDHVIFSGCLGIAVWCASNPEMSIEIVETPTVHFDMKLGIFQLLEFSDGWPAVSVHFVDVEKLFHGSFLLVCLRNTDGHCDRFGS